VQPARTQIVAMPRQKPEMPLRISALAIARVSRPKAISIVLVTGLRRSQQLVQGWEGCEKIRPACLCCIDLC
jgi:hypothetical protein